VNKADIGQSQHLVSASEQITQLTSSRVISLKSALFHDSIHK